MKTKESTGTHHVPADRTTSSGSNLNSFISYFLPEECKVRTRSDMYYIASVVCVGLTFVFPPCIIGAVLCFVESKKGGSQ